MQRSNFNPHDSSWNVLAAKSRAAEQARAQPTENCPTPGELFLEAGIVLAVALGMGVVAGLVAGG